jgi:hypothetical protein
MPFETYSTPIPNCVIKAEGYPYTESIKIVESIGDSWVTTPTFEKKHEKTKSNYDLGVTTPNSIKISFEEKLKTGAFCFLYYEDKLIAYTGLLITPDMKVAISHRMLSNPVEYPKHTGLWTDTVLLWQIKTAIEKDCQEFWISWDEHNFNQYKIFENGGKLRRFNFRTNDFILRKFDFTGKTELYNTMQYIAKLDLTKSDVLELINKQSFEKIVCIL